MPESPRSPSPSSAASLNGDGRSPAARTGAVWFHARDKQKLGPFFWEEFRNLAATGQLKPGDMVFQEGTQRWQTAAAVPGLFPAPAAPPPPAVLAPTPPETPPYEILEEVSRGDHCTIHKARDRRLDHLVALKRLRPELRADPAAREHLSREARLLAAQLHPDIVQLHQVGELDGIPYLAMELLEGGSLAKFAGQTMAAGRAAQIVLTLAQAIQALHQKQQIHRNLSPDHVLLTRSGAPKLIGFGWSIPLEQADEIQMGALFGDPCYMPPEKIRRQTVSPATDVYALGAILYGLLTGRPPFTAGTPTETLKRVLEQTPAPPSHFNATVPRPLDAVCLKCLRKEPHQRYASALDLAEDLRRFLTHEPLPPQAEIPKIPMPTAKKVRKRWPEILLVLMLVGAAAAASFWYFDRQGWSFVWPRAETTRNTEETPTPPVEKKSATPPPIQSDPRRLFVRQMARVAVVWQDNPKQALELLNDPAACPADLRDDAWEGCKRLCDFDRAELTRKHGEVTALAATPDGKWLASGGTDHAIRLWDVKSAKLQRTLAGHTAAISALAFQANGKALLSGGRDGQLKLWDLENGEERKGHFHRSGLVESKDDAGLSILAAAIASDGRTAASVVVRRAKDSGEIQSGKVELWDAIKGNMVTVLRGLHEPLAFSPDGKTLAVGGHLWDAATGTPRGAGHVPPGPVRAVAFTPDGGTLALGIEAGRRDGLPLIDARLWDVSTTPSTPRVDK